MMIGNILFVLLLELPFRLGHSYPLTNVTVKAREEGQFRCADGRYILKSWFCDGDTDCPDNEDEHNCGIADCELHKFPCAIGNSTNCIPVSWRCDGDSDCPGGSDEMNCTASIGQPQCTTQEFACRNKCIPMSQVCDGIEDCEGGKDEQDRSCHGQKWCARVNLSSRDHDNTTFMAEIRQEKQFCIGPGEMSWLQSMAQCRSLGMDLASVSSQQQQNDVVSLIPSVTGGISESLWLSGTDEDVTGKFLWASSGDHISYSNWFQGEPSEGPCHCLEMRRNDFKWRSYQCSHKQNFICEYFTRRRQHFTGISIKGN